MSLRQTKANPQNHHVYMYHLYQTNMNLSTEHAEHICAYIDKANARPPSTHTGSPPFPGAHRGLLIGHRADSSLLPSSLRGQQQHLHESFPPESSLGARQKEPRVEGARARRTKGAAVTWGRFRPWVVVHGIMDFFATIIQLCYAPSYMSCSWGLGLAH